MDTPVLREQWILTPADFERCPVWVRARDFDRDQAWYGDSNETTYRPWDGALPFAPRSAFALVLVNAVFQLSNGRSLPGYFNPVREDWDDPPPPRRMKDGSISTPLRWSSRRGGSQQSILALHSPVIFIREKAYDFHLRRDPSARARHIAEFYEAIEEEPEDVFPLEFSSDSRLFRGIVSGRLDGFYSFPLDKPGEIDPGRRYLAE